tara:strand:+ start:368 stop:583 length:216 start_codon:yes stop_codon:yes gene_type:complete
MKDKLLKTLIKKYDAEIEDALFKIDCFNDHALIIPEHTGISEEVDKLLLKISETEGKLSVLRQHYVKKETK